MEKSIAGSETDTFNFASGSPQNTQSKINVAHAANTNRTAIRRFYFKRCIDVVTACGSLVVLSPVILYVAIRTKISTTGTTIYKQERVGYNGKPFCIYKFRSMYEDAEKTGPLLSHDNDVRITKWGRKMRKWKLDELPQLWNILKGEMSFVGPRAERKFYIDQIGDYTSDFPFLLTVKPGLTSLGMIEFGYASSVKDMVKRMQFDLLYMKKISFLYDCKIMLRTLRIVLSGKGK